MTRQQVFLEIEDIFKLFRLLFGSKNEWISLLIKLFFVVSFTKGNKI